MKSTKLILLLVAGLTFAAWAGPAWCQEVAAAQTQADAPSCPACQELEPWHIPQPCLLQHYGIKMSGWLEQGISFNGDSPKDRFNGPVACNDLNNEYQMNQFWLSLERPVNTGGCGFDIGGRVDTLFGTDWRFGINNGLENKINGFHGQTYGTVIPQAYLEVGYNDLTVKAGHMAAILDYEVVPSPANPFYSHSYSYGYCVPQLVTGVLADYKLTDQFSVQAGFHRGWSQFEDNNDKIDFMGGFRWHDPCAGTTIAYAVSNGPQDPVVPTDTVGQRNRFVYSLVVQQDLCDDLKYVFVHDFGTEQGASVVTPGAQATWYGINQYLLYTINKRWSANLRAEWLCDKDGARVAGPGNIDGVRAWAGRGFAGDFYEVTVGLNWRPHPNFVFRPELRYDWYSGAPGYYGPLATPTRGMPFGDGLRTDQFVAACDLIFTF